MNRLPLKTYRETSASSLERHSLLRAFSQCGVGVICWFPHKSLLTLLLIENEWCVSLSEQYKSALKLVCLLHVSWGLHRVHRPAAKIQAKKTSIARFCFDYAIS